MPVAEPLTVEEFPASPEHELRSADLVRYRGDRAPKRDSRPPCDVRDLCVEVRAPSTWRYDIQLACLSAE